MRRTRRRFTQIYFAATKNFAVGNLFPAMHHAAHENRQVIGGLLLLIGRFVPLGLTILAAIIFNIWAFHVLMAPEGFPPALVVTLLELFLLWSYRESFAGIVRP